MIEFKTIWNSMPYIIDGHNLIGKIPHISLSQLDDETALLKILSQYFRRIRKKATVFFDQGSLLSENTFKSAYLHSQFVRPPSSADDAIIFRLRELRGNAKNYTVITSDHWIAVNTRKLGATVISSEEFSKKLDFNPTNRPKTQKKGNEDIDYWLNIFKK